MHRRSLLLGLAAALSAPFAIVLSGCGGASDIETGVPANVQPPADFDPGDGVTPDMKGKKQRNTDVP